MADAIVKLEFDPKVKVTEKLDIGIDGVTNQEHILQIASLAASFSPTTTVPVTKAFKDQVALTAGAVTLDLNVLVRDNLPDVSGDGLKVQVIIIHNPNTNTGTMTFVPGGTNGYNIFGAATASVPVSIGGTVVLFGNDKWDDINTSTNKTIDVTGTGTESFEIIIAMG